MVHPDSPPGNLFTNRSVTRPWFITFDPVGEKKIGDLIIISGTTNLPPGNNLSLEMYPVIMDISIDPVTKTTRGNVTGAVGSAMILSGTESVNERWSWTVNSASLPPARYEVNAIYAGNKSESDASIDIFGTFRFNLTR